MTYVLSYGTSRHCNPFGGQNKNSNPAYAHFLEDALTPISLRWLFMSSMQIAPKKRHVLA